jgi:pyruvate/2-oxoglutarate/acetoin dehydrogenase E1 component
VVQLGRAAVARGGSDVTLVALAATVPLALAAVGISAAVVDLRCLVPLHMATVLASDGLPPGC